MGEKRVTAPIKWGIIGIIGLFIGLVAFTIYIENEKGKLRDKAKAHYNDSVEQYKAEVERGFAMQDSIMAIRLKEREIVTDTFLVNTSDYLQHQWTITAKRRDIFHIKYKLNKITSLYSTKDIDIRRIREMFLMEYDLNNIEYINSSYVR
jgi:hypothetical protein